MQTTKRPLGLTQAEWDSKQRRDADRAVELEGESWGAASDGRNDPHYDRDLRERERLRQAAANQTASVHVIEGRDPHLMVRVHDGKHRSTLYAAAEKMGQLLEAPVVRDPGAAARRSW